jgi:hypothetical protein
VQVCVGAAFDFHAGAKPMAPRWMQQSGLEWLFRLVQEPRRLWRRYLVANSLFLAKFLGAFARRLGTTLEGKELGIGDWESDGRGPGPRQISDDRSGAMPTLVVGMLPVAQPRPHGHGERGHGTQQVSLAADSQSRSPLPTSAVPVDVVVPCYNERPVAEELIENLNGLSAALGERYGFRFLLVDDGSTDGTADRLRGLVNGRRGYEILRHERNRGVAAAIMTGIAAARAEIVCSMDADCSYDPRQLGEMIPMLVEGVDLVTASPYHPLGGVQGVPAWRLLLSRSASSLYREVLRRPLYTYTSCFRVYRRGAMAGIALAEGGFVGIAEILWRLDRRGSRIVECPAVLRSRRLGQSKMKLAGTAAGHLRLLARALRNGEG